MITVEVTARWDLKDDTAFERFQRSQNVAQFLFPLVGTSPVANSFDGDGTTMVVYWKWRMPEYHLGFRTPIYRDLASGTRGVFAALLEAMPTWMPPKKLVVLGNGETGASVVAQYDAQIHGDPWAYAADVIVRLNGE